MYIFKNAYLNIVRSKGRNILIGIIIMVVTIGSCIAITINKSGTNLVNTYRESNPLEVTLNLDTMSFRGADETTKTDFELMNVDTINDIGSLDMVTGYYYTLQSKLNSDAIEPVSYDDLFKKDETNESTNKEFSNVNKKMNMNSSDFGIIAYSDISYNEEFIDGNQKIIDGEMIDKDNTSNDIVISEELSTDNDIEVGDTITFINTNDDDIKYNLKVVGIYEIENETSTPGGRDMMQGSTSNQIYTNLTVLNKILSDDGTNTSASDSYSMSNSISSSFYINYEDLDSFTEKVRDIGVSDYYQIRTNEEEITNTLNPIKNIASFSFTFLIIILIVGSIVLTIINLFNIRERKYEIGVLRAIGMTKFKVTLQLVSEIFVVAVISLIIGTLIGTASSQSVSNYMLKNEIKNYSVKQESISNNFGGGDFQRPGFEGSTNNKPSNDNNQDKQIQTNVTDSFVDSLTVHTDFITIIELFGISLLLTIVSGTTAVMVVNKYEPNKILQNRG